MGTRVKIMILIEKYEKEINTIKELIKPAVDEHSPGEQGGHPPT